MSQFYEQTIRLTGMDADGRGICKPSALLDHLQIAAGFAAEEGGFGRETLVEKYGAFGCWPGPGSTWTAPCGGRTG